MRAGERPALFRSSIDRPCRRLSPKTDDKAAGSILASLAAAERSGCQCPVSLDAERLVSARRPYRRDAACHRPSVQPDAAAYRRAAASSVSPSVPVAAWRDAAAPSALLRASASSPAPSPEPTSWLLLSSPLPSWRRLLCSSLLRRRFALSGFLRCRFLRCGFPLNRLLLRRYFPLCRLLRAALCRGALTRTLLLARFTFLPSRFHRHGSAPLLLIAASFRLDRTPTCTILASWTKLALPPGESIIFFHYTPNANESRMERCEFVRERDGQALLPSSRRRSAPSLAVKSSPGAL